MILGSDLTYYESLHGLLLVTLLQLVSEETEVVLAVTRRGNADVDTWCKRCRRYFDVEVLASEEDVRGYASFGVVSKTGKPVSIIRLRHVGPPPFDEDLTALLAGLNVGDADQLLARLALRECDLDLIEVSEDAEELA
eukprot:UN0077